jgi:hypothetical protein
VKWALAGCCIWEATAITTGRVPTFTELSARHKWLAPAILGVLAVHLYRAPARR